MDNSYKGGYSQSGSNEVFFTPGNGELSPDVNGSGESLNEKNIASEIAPNDPSKIGNAAIINTPDQEKINEEVVLSSGGPLVDEVPVESSTGQSVSETPAIYQRVKTTKSTITPETKKAINQAKNTFMANGRAADFYGIVRSDITLANLMNSYNRILGGKD